LQNSWPSSFLAHLKTKETQYDPERRYFWKYYLIRHLYDRGYRRQDIPNLFRFIDWMMRLPDDLERQFIEQIEQMEAERHMQYISSVERFAMQKGEDKGREEGREAIIRLLMHLLTHRFDEVSETVKTRLLTLNFEQTEALVDVALSSQSLTEFARHLPMATNTSTGGA
jgi:flagellar biosynthesis/type III secretory pathway protein FliH